MFRKLGTLVLAALLMFPATQAFADDTRIGGEPGNVYVVASKDIRLKAETVQAIMYGGFAEYVVDFQFYNSGARQVVRLGFPFGLDDKTSDKPPNALAGFQAFQGSNRLGVTVSEGKDGPLQTGWFEHSAVFPPGTSMIQVHYLTRPSITAGADEGVLERAPKRYAGMASFTAWYPYTLHTGAGWAGTIGRAVVRYTFSADFEGWGYGGEADSADASLRTTPAGFSRPSANTVQWILNDVEPRQDTDGTSPFDINATYVMPLYDSYDRSADAPLPTHWAIKPLVDATASSVSAVPEDPDYSNYPKFPALSAIDGDPSTSWLCRTREDEGMSWSELPESLRVICGIERPVREVRVVPGYLLSPETYLEHGRPKRVRVLFSDGSSNVLSLADSPTVQRFPVNVDAAWAELKITDVYPGSRVDDVAIAEVELGSVTAPTFASFKTLLAAKGSSVAATAVGEVREPSEVETEPETTADAESTATSAAVDMHTPAAPTQRNTAQWVVALGMALAALISGVVVFARRPKRV